MIHLAPLKKLYYKYKNINYLLPFILHSPIHSRFSHSLYFRAKLIVFHIQKINKSKKFYCRCYLAKFFWYIFFLPPAPQPPSQCLFSISCYVKNSYHFLVILFSFLRGTIYSIWKSHLRQIQVLILIFNKKALVNISGISNSKNPALNFLSSVSRIVVNKCFKNSMRNRLSFALISNYL